MRRIAQTAFVSLCFAGLVPGFSAAIAADTATQAAQIDQATDATLHNLFNTVPGSKDAVTQAAGVLVFPDITKAGFIVGGSNGNGALRIGGAGRGYYGGRSVGYYKVTGASFGLQAGAESHSMAIVFRTRDALQRFENSNGWDLGADASVAVIQNGAGGGVNASQADKPVQVYVFGHQGLMGSLSLEGTKISRLDL